MNLIVPPFMTDPEIVAPCPCGKPPDDNTVIVKGEDMRRWFHEPCMDWLSHELNEDAYRDMDQWRKHRREAKDS